MRQREPKITAPSAGAGPNSQPEASARAPKAQPEAPTRAENRNRVRRRGMPPQRSNNSHSPGQNETAQTLTLSLAFRVITSRPRSHCGFFCRRSATCGSSGLGVGRGPSSSGPPPIPFPISSAKRTAGRILHMASREDAACDASWHAPIRAANCVRLGFADLGSGRATDFPSVAIAAIRQPTGAPLR